MPSKPISVSFEAAAEALEEFAQEIGGTFTISAGLDQDEIDASKPAVVAWLESQISDPLARLLGENPSNNRVKAELDKIYSNAFVEYKYRIWSIRMHVRNVGFGIERPGRMSLRITVPIGACDFRMSLFRRSMGMAESHRSNLPQTRIGVPGFLAPFVPAGIVSSLGSKRTIFEINFPEPSLNETYLVEATDKERGEQFANDADLQLYLGKLPDIYSLTIGYLDTKSMIEKPIFELLEEIGFDSTEPLANSLRLTQSCLDALEQFELCIEP